MDKVREEIQSLEATLARTRDLRERAMILNTIYWLKRSL